MSMRRESSLAQRFEEVFVSDEYPRPNIIPALVYIAEGIMGTFVLCVTFWAFRHEDISLNAMILAVSLPGYVMQLGYVAYLTGRLSPRARRMVWFTSMILNIVHVPLTLIPMVLFAGLASESEQLLMLMVALNMVALAGLGIWTYVRERRATL